MSGDVDSLPGGLCLLDPLVDRILVDTVSQQQGWLRVYGKYSSHTLDSRDHSTGLFQAPRGVWDGEPGQSRGRGHGGRWGCSTSDPPQQSRLNPNAAPTR